MKLHLVEPQDQDASVPVARDFLDGSTLDAAVPVMVVHAKQTPQSQTLQFSFNYNIGK